MEFAKAWRTSPFPALAELRSPKFLKLKKTISGYKVKRCQVIQKGEIRETGGRGGSGTLPAAFEPQTLTTKAPFRQLFLGGENIESSAACLLDDCDLPWGQHSLIWNHSDMQFMKIYD